MKRFAKSIGLKAKFFSKKEIREEMEKFLQLDPKEHPMKPPKDTIFYQTLIKNKEE